MYITGFGTIVPGADNNDLLWDNIRNKKIFFNKKTISNGIDILVAEEPKYDLDMYNIPKKNLRRMDIQMVYSLISSINCVKDAKLNFDNDELKKSTGVIAGSFFAQIAFGMEQVKRVEIKKTTKISPYTGMAFYYGANSGEISLLFQTQGENCAIISGSNIGMDAVSVAEEMMLNNRNEVILVCASENIVYDIMYYSLKKNNSITSSKYVPFADDENGAVFANGAMAFSLETQKSVLSRNVKPLAILKSHSTSYCPGYLFEHNKTIINYYIKTVKYCIEKAKIEIDDIDLVIPTASGIKDDDFFEKEALKILFGNREKIIYTPKPVVGNGLSYNVLLDFFVATKCINESYIPGMPESIVTKDKVFDKMMVIETVYKEIKNVLVIHKSFIDGKISSVVIGKSDLYANS